PSSPASGRRSRCRRPAAPGGSPPAPRAGPAPRKAGIRPRENPPRRSGERVFPGRPGCRAGRRGGRRSPRASASRGGGCRRGAGGGDDELGALVETGAGVVEGVDGGGGLEVEVARPVDALEQVAEEAGDVVDVEGGVVLAGDDEQVLGQRELPLAEDGVGAG